MGRIERQTFSNQFPVNKTFLKGVVVKGVMFMPGWHSG